MTLQFADSNLGRIGFEREAAFNQKNPTLNLQIARITSSSLAANKETQVSDELRADRMVGDLIETAFTSGGDLGFELSLGGTWFGYDHGCHAERERDRSFCWRARGTVHPNRRSDQRRQ